jgi:endonuclease/exonuclease/phosphatase family metal-dependent hydrolase
VTAPGAGPGSVRFASYNMLDLFAGDSAADLRHYELVAGVVRSLDADVLAVQEILAPDAETAARRLRQVAGDAGLSCEVPGPSGPEAAVAFGGHGYHVGLMWRDGIEPVPGSLRCYGGRDFWHGLALVTLDVGGTLIRHGAFHASPFCRRLRADQNERLVAAVTRPRGEPPVLVGADWNTESADRDQAGALYEPADPYAGVEWFADLIYQCQWDYDEQGRRRHWADREPGDVLWAGGLHDAAAALSAAWQPTVGHHRADTYGKQGVRRRIDAVRVTGALVPALRTHQVIDTAQTRAASDHLPVVVDYAPAGR